jgi:hypothetical protein
LPQPMMPTLVLLINQEEGMNQEITKSGKETEG